MASSIHQPKLPIHYYQPIVQSKFPPALHLEPQTPNHQFFPHSEKSPNLAEFQATQIMTSGPTSMSPPAHIGSIQERLCKLEVLLPVIHDIYRGEIATLRAEIESLKAVITSKAALNKNATPFVPGPSPMTPTTPHDFQRVSQPALAVTSIGQDSELSTPPGQKSFDSSKHHDQIQTLSQQVNVLSSTMSQLITTLFTSPNGAVASNNSNPLTPSPNSNSTCLPNGPPPPSPMPLYPTNSGPIPIGAKINNLQPVPARAGQRNRSHLTLIPALDSPLPPNMHKSSCPPPSQIGAGPPLSRSNLRLRLLSPTVCPSPMSLSSPLSPLPHESSAGVAGAAPANSLAAKWEQLGITGDVLRAIVRYGVGPPSKTQQKSIPNILLGKDLISQSNPIQERIQSYIIPALQLIMNDVSGTPININGHPTSSQPVNFSRTIQGNTSVKVLVITATLDEASQAHRLARGIASLLPQMLKIEHCGSSEPLLDLTDPNTPHHVQPHLLIGTPSKLLDSVNGLRGYTFDAHSFRCVILDEMDQLLARNLSDMVTSLMAFLPSNSCPEINFSNQSASPPEHEVDVSAIQPPTSGSLGEWTSSRQLRQSPQNSVTSSTSSSQSRTNPPGRQTCIFSCTVPQDVLTYARTLNVRLKVIVRREDSSNSTTSSHTSSCLTPLTSSCFDMSDPRTPHLSNFPWTNQSGNGNSSNTHQLLRNLSQYFYLADSITISSLNHRERKLRALLELLFDPDVRSLRAGRGQLVIIYCNSVDSVESVSYALGQNKIDALALYQDMGAATRHSLLAKFGKAARQSADHQIDKSIKALVVYDVLAKTLADISKDQPSIVINFELPRAVEDYIHRAGCIINLMNLTQNKRVGASLHNDAALVNLVMNSNEVETVKSIESFYRCKIQQVNSI